jgi:tetratricopeptide (TPR) repeat protein
VVRASALAGAAAVDGRGVRIAAWSLLLAVCVGVRVWNALAGPRMWGYDAWGHVAYVLFLDVYRAVPYADQGWSYFHPPLYYALGALLARTGDADVLMRGLAMLGTLASLGVAGFAAWLVRRASPCKPWLALLAFAGVALLPVHLYASPMPGNALWASFLEAGGLAVFASNELRETPSRRVDVVVAVLIGLALLTRFSALILLLSVCSAVLARAVLDSQRRAALRRAAPRLLLLAGVSLAIAGPYYARNTASFGTPFAFSRSLPLIAQVEQAQRPGARSWRDYLSISPALLRDADPRAPQLLHSVWGTAYAGMWADVMRESDVARSLAPRGSDALLICAGLLPTGLALSGAALALCDLRRGRRRAIYSVLCIHALATLSAFAAFAWWAPIWSALKSTYLLGLSLPWAAFLARGVEAVAAWRGRAIVIAGLVGVAGLGAAANTEGLLQRRRADAPAAGAVYFYFGDYPDARRIFGRLATGAADPAPWLENLAAVALAEGDPGEARRLYARAAALEGDRPDPYRAGQLAEAVAFDGDRAGARALLDRALAEQALPELLANRGVIRAVRGDVRGARRDLRAALGQEPELLPAWLALAALEPGAAGAPARAGARRAACSAPRRYPHALGPGEVIEWGVGRRWLLLRAGRDAVAPALPAFYRDACRLAASAP